MENGNECQHQQTTCTIIISIIKTSDKIEKLEKKTKKKNSAGANFSLCILFEGKPKTLPAEIKKIYAKKADLFIPSLLLMLVKLEHKQTHSHP